MNASREEAFSDMKKNAKIIILIAVLAIVAFLMYREANPAADSEAGGRPGIRWPLKRGSGATYGPDEAEAVKNIQTALNTVNRVSRRFDPLIVDGQFGELTEAALVIVAGVREVTEDFYNRFATA